MAYRRIARLSGGGEEIYRYTTSLPHDHEILPYAIRVLEAHTLHLKERGIIPSDAADKVLETLRELREVEPPREGYEDVWEWIEDELEKLTGGASRWIWIGRSRNDHMSAALRLLAADRLKQLISAAGRLEEAAGKLARKYQGSPIPLHTHGIPSQVGSVACLADAWAEAARTISEMARSVLRLVERSPLGAGAGAGTLAPIDPEGLSRIAGLGKPLSSSVYAAGSRLDVSAAAAAAALALAEASRIAGDLILYSSPYVGIFRLPDSHVATSSIMPHKRNPATMEVLIARAKRAAGCLAGILSIQAGLPSGYSLDLQEANPCIYEVLRDAAESLYILADSIENLEVDEDKALETLERFSPWSAEEAERRSLEEGKPLRETYAQVAKNLESLKGMDPKWPLRLRKTGCRE